MPIRRHSRFVIVTLLVLSLIPTFAFALTPRIDAAAQTSPTDVGPGDSDPGLYAPLLDEERDEIYAETAGRLTRYRVDAMFTPAGDRPATISGELDLNYYNATGEAQDALYFRLYPNDEEYAEGGLILDNVEVAGAAVTPELSVEDTVARIELPVPVASDETVDLTLSFTTTIPTAPRQSYGMFSHDQDTGTYALAHWEPLLAGFDPVDGWELAPPSENGDPVFTNAALYDVTLTVPDDLTVITTGIETSSDNVGDGLTSRHFVSGPVRDFVMAIDDDLEVLTASVGGTTVRSWFSADNLEMGREVLRFGVQSMEVYSRLFGPYPYSEMDIVEVDLQRALGVEFPEITYIDAGLYEPSVGRDPYSLEFTLVHEMAHQWWYALVGNDQYQHAFIDEGLTNFVSTVYMREIYGDEVGDNQVDRNLKLWYLTMLFGGPGDQVVDQPTDDFPSSNAYGATIYGKAALGFKAIHDEIGADAFFAGLTDYARTFCFKVATPDDLREALERASGRDLSEIWRHWFNAAEGEQDFDLADLDDVQRNLGR